MPLVGKGKGKGVSAAAAAADLRHQTDVAHRLRQAEEAERLCRERVTTANQGRRDP